MPKGIQKRTIAAFNILATLLACMVTKKLSISPGKAMFNWLYAIGAQQPKWFLGSLANRNRFGAWIAFLARGLADPDFLLKFATGSLVWSFNTPNGSNATTPAVYGGIVYFGTGRGIVYARNATTGVQIWSYTTPTGGAVTSSPALALGSKTLFFGSNDRYLYALNMMTGTLLWRYLTGGQVSSSPAVANSRVFFGAKDTKVYALGIVIPPLSATLNANPVILRSAMVSNLTVTVRHSTGPISGANLTFTSSAGGTFSQPVMTIPGTYVANYTAPIVTSSISDMIQVVAIASGYLNAAASKNIMVNPYPPLTVAVSAKPGTTTPGSEVLLMIKIGRAHV